MDNRPLPDTGMEVALVTSQGPCTPQACSPYPGKKPKRKSVCGSEGMKEVRRYEVRCVAVRRKRESEGIQGGKGGVWVCGGWRLQCGHLGSQMWPPLLFLPEAMNQHFCNCPAFIP